MFFFSFFFAIPISCWCCRCLAVESVLYFGKLKLLPQSHTKSHKHCLHEHNYLSHAIPNYRCVFVCWLFSLEYIVSTLGLFVCTFFALLFFLILWFFLSFFLSVFVSPCTKETFLFRQMPQIAAHKELLQLFQTCTSLVDLDFTFKVTPAMPGQRSSQFGCSDRFGTFVLWFYVFVVVVVVSLVNYNTTNWIGSNETNWRPRRREGRKTPIPKH